MHVTEHTEEMILGNSFEKSMSSIEACYYNGGKMEMENWIETDLKVGMDGYPDPAGFPLSGKIRLRPDCMFHAGSDRR